MMIDKMIRLTKALWHETVKRIPYIMLVLAILIFVQLLHNTEIAQRNSTDTKNLLHKVASLSQDNKNLSEQNHELSQQNIALSNQNSQHIDCLAKLFAQYTQTLEPVQSVALQNCVIVQGTSAGGATSRQGVSPQASQGLSGDGSVGSSPNSTPNSTPAQSGNSQNPQPKSPSLLQQITQPIKNIINAL